MKAIFIIFFATISAATLAHPDERGQCCTPGRTTTCISELLGEKFKLTFPILIAGSRNDFYGIWKVKYDYRPQKRFVAHLYEIRVYILEVPATKSSKYTLLAITVTTACPQIFELKSDTEGNVTGLPLPWKTVYRTIKMNQNYNPPTTCDIIDAVSNFIDPTISPPGAADITLFMNDLTYVQNVHLYDRGSSPSVHCQCVKEIYPNTYVEKNFYEYSVRNNSCRIPDNGIGRILIAQRYDLSNFLQPGGICRLATAYAVLGASVPFSPLGRTTLSFTSSPYNRADRMNAVVTSNVNTDVYLWLRQMCARTTYC